MLMFLILGIWGKTQRFSIASPFSTGRNVQADFDLLDEPNSENLVTLLPALIAIPPPPGVSQSETHYNIRFSAQRIKDCTQESKKIATAGPLGVQKRRFDHHSSPFSVLSSLDDTQSRKSRMEIDSNAAKVSRSSSNILL
ncbi:hypothetical protein L2E82_38998 [Cichorium intybus]|uniref:Uncharacterized protein n=1 Tax=Cichorium intybus TaxID=13427 RepID=A0ACB9AHZ4_CICIN|nr:hypothetical protein L2E82_38998 [Cichorium intybus]